MAILYICKVQYNSQITNSGHWKTGEHFKVRIIIKLVHFKIIIICFYRNSTGNTQILLHNLETILDILIKRKDIIIGDLNINFLKNYYNKKNSEVVFDMFGLQAVINVLTRVIKEAKSATDEIILNTELWGFKTDLLERALTRDSRPMALSYDSGWLTSLLW